VIIVDTSVWVSVLRSPSSPEAPLMTSLLDADEVGLAAPVRIELMSGVSPKDRAALKRALSALPVLYPTDDTWRLLDSWTEKAGKAGYRFGVGDLMVGALAAEAGALIWSLDGDFARMEKLKLVDCYEP
jgi:predicted nucleic acid-binding protein